MDKAVLARNMLLMRAAGALAREAESLGIPVIFLKGVALLSDEASPRWASRQMSDIDMLARTRDLCSLRAIFLGQGLVPMDGSRQAWGDFRGPVPILIDLHSELRHDRDLEGLFARARTVELDGARARALSREDEILECVSHAFLHHGHLEARALEDLRALSAAAPDWSALAARARALGLAELVFAAFEAAGEIPAGLRALRGRGPKRWAAARAASWREERPGADYLLPVLFKPGWALRRALEGGSARRAARLLGGLGRGALLFLLPRWSSKSLAPKTHHAPSAGTSTRRFS